MRHGRHVPQPQRARTADRRGAGRDVRPGPAGDAAQGPHDQRHPDQRPQEHLRRAPRQDGADERRVPRQRPPAADHRPDRLEGRPPCRRSLPDGRRPPAGRLAFQRHHSAAGARRRRRFDSAFRRQPAEARRPAQLQGLHARDGDAAGRGDQGPAEHHHLRRYRLGKDDAAQHAVQLHLQRRPHRDDRGRGRTAAAAGTRRAAGNAAAEHRRQGRDHRHRPGPQRPAYATRTDHHRRMPWRRDARHAAGDEHRPRRLADDDPRQHAA